MQNDTKFYKLIRNRSSNQPKNANIIRCNTHISRIYIWITYTLNAFLAQRYIVLWRKLRPNIKHIKSHIERTCCVDCRSFADRSRSRRERRTVQVHTTITATASGCTLCDRHDIKKKQRMQTHAHGNRFC